MRSVHDNILNAYTVDGVAKRIILHTAYEEAEPFEYTDILFDGVMDHFFRDTVLPSIIFDVEPGDVAHTLTRDKDAIDEGHRRGGWPSFYAPTVAEMVDKIASAGCFLYTIVSSYGLDGWVVSRTMRIIPADGG